MKLEIWTLIPALMLLTAFYTIIPDFSYSWNEWLLGNGIVSVLIGCVYIVEGIYKQLKKE